MTLRERLVGFAARVIIKQLMSGYEFPFERSNDRIARMPMPERAEYYRKAREMLDNPVYKQEFEEDVRHFYSKLTLDSKTDIEDAAYRMTLSFIQLHHRRMILLAQSQEKIPHYDVGNKF